MDNTDKTRQGLTDEQLLRGLLAKLSDQQMLGIITDIGPDDPVSIELQERMRTIKGEATTHTKKENTQSPRKNKGDAQTENGTGKPGLFDAIIRFADRAHMTDPQVYNSAKMNRALWYRIRDNKDAKPRKRTVLKIALVLHLNYWELNYLVNLAGFSFLPRHDKTDSIITQCVMQNIYDADTIDELLHENGEETLFSEKL